MYQIECKLAKLFNNHFEQREQIVTGKYDPTAEEATWKFDADVRSDMCSLLFLKNQLPITLPNIFFYPITLPIK